MCCVDLCISCAPRIVITCLSLNSRFWLSVCMFNFVGWRGKTYLKDALEALFKDLNV